jgi:hypothetical protein
VLNDNVMNEKNPEGLSVLMDLGLSDHYAQMLNIPGKIFSNMPQRIERTL